MERMQVKLILIYTKKSDLVPYLRALTSYFEIGNHLTNSI